MQTNKKYLALLILFVLFISGCQAPQEANEKEATTEKIEVTDSKKSLEVPFKPKKIVVFDLGALDILKSLGHEEAVIGVPTDNLPEYLQSFSELPSVGGIKEPDLEKINELQPDLIIISGRQEESYEDLNKIAPTLYLELPSGKVWEGTKDNIELLAKVMDSEKEADEKIATLEKEIASTKKQAEELNLKTLVTLISEGQLSAYGSGSRFGIVHETFGFPEADENIEVSTHGQSVSYEYVLDINPEVVFVIDRTKAIGGDEAENDVAKNELVTKTKAAKENRVISLTPDVWYLAGGGLEGTHLMLEDVQKAFKN